MSSTPPAALHALVVVIRLILMAVARQTGRATRVVAANSRVSVRATVRAVVRRRLSSPLPAQSSLLYESLTRENTVALLPSSISYFAAPTHTQTHHADYLTVYPPRSRISGSGPVAIGKVMRRLRLYDSNKLL